MAWSDAARRAAAEARRRNARKFGRWERQAQKAPGFRRFVTADESGQAPYGSYRTTIHAVNRRGKSVGHFSQTYGSSRVEESKNAMKKHTLMKKATNYTGDSRRQGAAIKKLAGRGYHPKTGKYVGKKRAAKAARRIGDLANE